MFNSWLSLRGNNQDNMRVIGFFDSGVGGTSIWREVNRILPGESTLYIADSKNAPYGNKTKEEIVHLCEKNTEFLLNKNSKIIVVACNTATTNAITHLRAKYKVPFIGIEPAIKPAALRSQTKSIGILATRGTLSSTLFHTTLQRYVKENGISIVEQVGDGIVELIEDGKMNTPQMKQLLIPYIQNLTRQKIDYLVLGCTHYPYLKPLITTLLTEDITLIDSGMAVAQRVQSVLEEEKILNTNTQTLSHTWLTNHKVEILQSFVPSQTKVDVFFSEF